MHWLDAPEKLAREQSRVLREAIRRGEPFAVSAITILEVAVLIGNGGRTRQRVPMEELLGIFESDPGFHTLPITVEIAREVAAIRRVLHDPADRAIVATARVHGLKLVTSDERIIDSGLVPVII